MNTYYFIVVSVILVVFGILMFPTLNLIVNSGNTTGFLPLTAAAQTGLPYAFLGFIVYAIILIAKR